MASFAYNVGMAGFANGSIDWVNDDIRCLLVKTADLPDGLPNTVSAVLAGTPDELTNGSYARVVVAGRSVTDNDPANTVKLDATDTTFPALAGPETVTGALIFKFVTTDADHIPIFAMDFTNTASDGTDYIVAWPTAGISVLTGT